MVAPAALHSGVPTVSSGLDVLLKSQLKLLRGRRFGLLSTRRQWTRGWSTPSPCCATCAARGSTALFAPEHGVWGAPQDHATIATDRDPLTGMRVSSLYGERREPTPSMLAGLDVMVIDLQDVGSRYYTFAWTMALTMRACARAGVAVIVLDRPNPLGGEILEGNIPDPAFASFVGLHPLPIRHGLTIGEHARYLVREHGYGCALTVVPMRGWRRRMLWEDTDVPWVAPSPNMPTLDTARVYPGGCLIEGTNLSEGRGTTRPFEWIGAPWLDAHAYAAATTAATPARRDVPAGALHADVPQMGESPVRRGAGARHGSGALQAGPEPTWR